MKKIKQLKGYVIAALNNKKVQEIGNTTNTHFVFTLDEWSQRPCCYPEYECSSLIEAMNNIN